MLFMHFIFFCGWTHLNEVLVFVWPSYRFFTLITILTAIFSCITAVVLPSTVIYLIKLPSFEDIRIARDRAQEEIVRRELKEHECLDMANRLKIQVNILESQLYTSDWVAKTNVTIRKIRGMLETDTDVYGQ